MSSQRESKSRGLPKEACDLLEPGRPALACVFAPKSVALIGASEEDGSVGRILLEALTDGHFGGAIYPVNPRRTSVRGLKAYPRIEKVPGQVDLAVIATPAGSVPDLVAECAKAGAKAAVIVSSGFTEGGEKGAELERQILANRGKMRIVGPNCLGVMFPHAALNATFAGAMARPGRIAFLSQSGAMCAAILDWSRRENVGFSAFVSVGSMLDVGWGDLIYQLGDDLHTRSILIYMETIGDARSFLSAAREVALTKPIIVIKVGRTAAAARVAASHTGSLTGADAALDAAFRRVGVLRVDSVGELFDMAEVLGKQPRPRGPRLAIVSNGGGPGVLATDALVERGAELAGLGPDSLAALDALFPKCWSGANPIDLPGDTSPDRFAEAVEIARQDPNTDGVLTILTPRTMTNPTATARALQPLAQGEKPLLSAWMGGPAVEEGEMILNDAGIPTFKYPDRAARAFADMWLYTRNLRALYETPELTGGEDLAHRERASKIVQKARRAGRSILTEDESKRILSAYGIPTAETRIARNEDEAVQIAKKIGCPVELKLASETVEHKAVVGGVGLNLRNATAVRDAWRKMEKAARASTGKAKFLGVTVQRMIERKGVELILGSSMDPQLGPVLMFGAGGQLVEAYADCALGLPPLNATLARRMMERTRIFPSLAAGGAGPPVDPAALENLLVRFSQLVVEQRTIAGIDINPLLLSGGELIALDARMILHPGETKLCDLPTPAIRPYPVQYVTPLKLKDGATVVLRPIRPEDEHMMVKFHQTLSEESVHYRYFGMLPLDQRTAHERLTRICFNDFDREIALVVEHGQQNARAIRGVGRLSRMPGVDEAEFALVISDEWQGRGLGTALLNLLLKIGRQEGLARIVGHIMSDNAGMKKTARKVGFRLRAEPGTDETLAQIRL